MVEKSFPTYEEWRIYVFTQAHADDVSEVDASTVEWETKRERETWMASLPPTTLADYLIRCFTDAKSLDSDFNEQQLADATWHIFGCFGEYFRQIRDPEVPASKVADCYRAVGVLYKELYDVVCCRRGRDSDGLYTHANGDPLDQAVGMIWDMNGGIENAILFPELHADIFETAIQVLRDILLNCRTATCKGSALHAIGHMQRYHPRLAQDLIDEFLALPGQPEHLVEYAKQARVGNIQ